MASPLAALDRVFGPVFDGLLPGAASGLRPSQRADFQVDGALALARSLGRPPRDVASEVLEAAKQGGLMQVCEEAVVAGPGFINLTLSPEFLAGGLRSSAADPDLGIAKSARPVRAVVDYASPNAAKQMHVGHLRSAIIGDAIVRLLEASGHEVIRENHVGDWGAPFGMLIEHLHDLGEAEGAHELAVGDLENFYQAARAQYDRDPTFAERARGRVVLLQAGDPETLKLWEALVQRSVSHFDAAFHRLGTKLTRDDVVGESYYNPMLAGVVADLGKAGLLVESDGAMCVFPPGFSNREGKPLPLIVQNSVGGYTYATTDLAAIRDRVDRLGARLLVYVVGLPQTQHFQMVFAAARMAGWLPDDAEAVHVGFGSILGPDGKMFRTREGGTVKLAELLDEAVDRARSLLLARAEGEGDAQAGGAGPVGGVVGAIEALAEAVGIGAVKYADLASDRTRDYRFDWDRMLSLDGNTAPYIQYAHARVCSILRRAVGAVEGAQGEGAQGEEAQGEGAEASAGGPAGEIGVAKAARPAGGAGAAGGGGAEGDGAGRLRGPFLQPALVLPPAEPEERELAKRLLGFADAVEATLATYSPHKLCGYLFDLATSFTNFYEHCPVLRAPDRGTRSSRLVLCALSGAVLERGLSFLGIAAPERM